MKSTPTLFGQVTRLREGTLAIAVELSPPFDSAQGDEKRSTCFENAMA